MNRIHHCSGFDLGHLNSHKCISSFSLLMTLVQVLLRPCLNGYHGSNCQLVLPSNLHSAPCTHQQNLRSDFNCPWQRPSIIKIHLWSNVLKTLPEAPLSHISSTPCPAQLSQTFLTSGPLSTPPFLPSGIDCSLQSLAPNILPLPWGKCQHSGKCDQAS